VDLALLSFLHLLVLVYWLGGDLGAFYTSRYLTLPSVSADRRLMAAKIVGDVDMAPRSALILALPTGLALADAASWLTIPDGVMFLVVIAAVAWLALAWRLHAAHGGAPAWMRALDLTIRWLLLSGLIAWASAGLAGLVPMPGFLALKMYLLAGCIALGLWIRHVLVPLGPALAGLSGEDPARHEADLARTLHRARPLVVAIWALIATAALLGALKPAFT
jgi:hypothetical protein